MFCCDLWLQLKRNAWHAFFVVCAAIVGIACGFAVYKLPNAYWWQNNRLDFCYKLMYGGFVGVMWSIFLSYLCVFAISLVAKRFAACKFLCYVGAFLCGIYVGGVLLALWQSSAVLCVLYAIFFVAVNLSVALLCLFLALTEESCCCFADAISGAKGCIIVLSCGIFAQLLLIFLFLRTITLLI